MAVVDNDKYKPNSYRAKAEAEAAREEPQKVIKGTAKRHEKGIGEKLKDNFLGEEVDNVGDYLIFDVIIPGIKEIISNAIIDSVNMIFFGEARRPKAAGKGSYVSYDSISRTRNKNVARRAQFDFSDIEFDSRMDAAEVLESLEDIIEMYDFAKVSDLYSLSGMSSSHTDQNWGWTNINSAEIIRKRDGAYILSMPKPKSLR